MLASGAVTDLETAKAQIGQLSRELDDVRAALESERDARDADNAASAASARKLEAALETANTTRVADTSGATRRLEAGVARAEETLAMEKAARRADANALAEHEAHATEQAVLIVELRSRIRALSTDATSHAKTAAAESSATITRLESDLAKANAALQREGKSREADAFALAELGASVKQKMAVVAEHEATIARLRSTLASATAGHKAELAALASTQPSATATASRPRAAPVVDDNLTAELPRTAPLLQNPQRAPPPQRRSPSCRPTYVLPVTSLVSPPRLRGLRHFHTLPLCLVPSTADHQKHSCRRLCPMWSHHWHYLTAALSLQVPRCSQLSRLGCQARPLLRPTSRQRVKDCPAVTQINHTNTINNAKTNNDSGSTPCCTAIAAQSSRSISQPRASETKEGRRQATASRSPKDIELYYIQHLVFSTLLVTVRLLVRVVGVARS
jgi:hypothetical protein